MRKRIILVIPAIVFSLTACRSAVVESEVQRRPATVVRKVPVQVQASVPDLQLVWTVEDILRMSGVGVGTVKVASRDGVITLSGEVPQGVSRTDLVKVIAQLKGVEKVESQLKLAAASPSAAVETPPPAIFSGTSARYLALLLVAAMILLAAYRYRLIRPQRHA